MFDTPSILLQANAGTHERLACRGWVPYDKLIDMDEINERFVETMLPSWLGQMT